MKGSVGFTDYYQKIYAERWALLCAQLQAPVAKTTWPGGNANTSGDGYELDPASVIVAQQLQVQPGDRVLDLCAAPGGKSLILVQAMGVEGSLVANELSVPRRQRLLRVLREYLPAEIFTKVRVTGFDGQKWGLHEQGIYDRVLVDAPCSGERHLLENPSELAQWSEARGRHLAHRQYALLVAALTAAKPGAQIVYSTCSLNPVENDGVIAKLLKKKSGQVEVVPVDNIGEATAHGVQILPDRPLPDGAHAGPMYFCVLRKL